jgi:hypothetical protein
LAESLINDLESDKFTIELSSGVALGTLVALVAFGTLVALVAFGTLELWIVPNRGRTAKASDMSKTTTRYQTEYLDLTIHKAQQQQQNIRTTLPAGALLPPRIELYLIGVIDTLR